MPPLSSISTSLRVGHLQASKSYPAGCHCWLMGSCQGLKFSTTEECLRECPSFTSYPSHLDLQDFSPYRILWFLRVQLTQVLQLLHCLHSLSFLSRPSWPMLESDPRFWLDGRMGNRADSLCVCVWGGGSYKAEIWCHF